MQATTHLIASTFSPKTSVLGDIAPKNYFQDLPTNWVGSNSNKNFVAHGGNSSSQKCKSER